MRCYTLKIKKKSVEYDDTTFWGLLKISGINEFENYSLIWATLCFIFLNLAFYINGNYFLNIFKLSEELSLTLLGASSSIFGIVIGALAISVILFKEELLPELLSYKLLHKFLFPFWLALSLWGLSIFFLFLNVIFLTLEWKYITNITFNIILFLFPYSIFYTLHLTGLIIQLALQRAQLK